MKLTNEEEAICDKLANMLVENFELSEIFGLADSLKDKGELMKDRCVAAMTEAWTAKYKDEQEVGGIEQIACGDKLN